MASSYPAPSNAAATNNYIAGGLIAGFVGLVVLLSLLCFYCFRRSRAKNVRVERQTTAFPHTGLARQQWITDSNLSPAIRGHGRPSITIPEKSIVRTTRSHGFSDKAGTLPCRESSPSSSRSSFQPPTSNPSPRSRTLSSLNPARSRHNRSSSGFSMYSSNPSPSRSNHRVSPASSMFPMHHPKPARQLFEPSLPDELAIGQCGEYLTVLQSFDDGWYLVARDASPPSSSSRRTSLFSMLKGEIDIGLVPAWVFAEPIKGSSVTRPFRSSSVNALYSGGKPVDARNAVASWSFFA